MVNEWSQRYAGREDPSRRLKEQLATRIFGPYAGFCSNILVDVAERLRKKEHYDAQTCLGAPLMRAVSEIESSSEYNLAASLECIEQADACVFVFMDTDLWKFAGANPTSEPSRCIANTPPLPSDLNSSVAVEFEPSALVSGVY